MSEINVKEINIFDKIYIDSTTLHKNNLMCNLLKLSNLFKYIKVQDMYFLVNTSSPSEKMSVKNWQVLWIASFYVVMAWWYSTSQFFVTLPLHFYCHHIRNIRKIKVFTSDVTKCSFEMSLICQHQLFLRCLYPYISCSLLFAVPSCSTVEYIHINLFL